ncbi:MAG TPA: hypothetical protein VMY06_14655 [Sedimentisphaerales bacterium]|nr:hypothetical protein [Sedimentisphaerales bacterium]HUU15618.1 hypothetical protein [Sedimentisphaerales bacterium]
MENAKPQKTYTVEDVLAARLQGRKEAEEYLQLRINNISKTHHQLLTEIFRLDLNEPVVAVSVPYKFAQMVIDKLRKRNRKDWHAKMIQYYMRRSDRQVFGDVDMRKVLVALDNNENGI